MKIGKNKKSDQTDGVWVCGKIINQNKNIINQNKNIIKPSKSIVQRKDPLQIERWQHKRLYAWK